MRPNILFILADQFRSDALGHIGGHNWTPHLDAVAARGTTFTNAYAAAPHCIPSRLSLATGLNPRQFGVETNTPCRLNPHYSSWMSAIRSNGYSTSLFGKTHLHWQRADLREGVDLIKAYGFSSVDEISGPWGLSYLRCNLTDLWEREGLWDIYRADLENRANNSDVLPRPSPLPFDLYYDVYVARTARNHITRLPDNQPWFCCVSFAGPHEPWDAPQPYASKYDPALMPAPRPRTFDALGSVLDELLSSPKFSPQMSAHDVAALRANYAGSVSLIDDLIGEILDVIEARGETDNTLVAFASDHGEMNGDYGLLYKANFLDPAIKTPLIVAPPVNGDSKIGSACDQLTALMDVGATLADYAGAPHWSHRDARSLRGLIENRTTHHRDYVVSQFQSHTCIITPKLKIELDEANTPVLAFDRSVDPLESRNIVASPSYSESITAITAMWQADSAPQIPVQAAVILEREQ